ncbi:glycosyltransferase family 4 protein [Sporosarcina highlanderae]|uniref:Glycosyltransferase family 4 protein n=1 Tax=Sporosarcina highlanderae TaxID=3035916 RepID=A0ABT8JMX8_9BACL|nr:glycosyltransferase family 4 protein [Sporosarcina highlanderae]MDN4605926.1 glycosyltransferase family 4 protein [Sporosarcina highlanderae]
MQDILIIAHFTQVPGEIGNGRFHYIAENIDKEKSSVEVVTTSFSHRTKSRRIITNEQLNSISYKLTILQEPGYKKNVSIKRFYSHYIMGKSLKRYFEKRKKPDVIYCSVPSLDVARIAANYAKKQGVRFIIDIQDLWPEAFKMVFNIPLISDILFYPMKKQANYIYSNADEIIAVSQTYADRALSVNNKCKEAHSVYLGTELAYFDKLVKENILLNKPKDEIWVAYIGTLGHSYDLYSVIDALAILKDNGISNVKFIVMGDGPLRSKFENHANEKGIYTEFTGRLEYNKMIGILKSCDIAVNPIKAGSAGSIINKVGDYAAAGLPVLNTQESNEYKELVEYYRVGFNCKNGCSLDLYEKLLDLINDKNLREDMGRNNRELAEDLFNRGKTYRKISNLLGESIS